MGTEVVGNALNQITLLCFYRICSLLTGIPDALSQRARLLIAQGRLGMSSAPLANEGEGWRGGSVKKEDLF